MSGEKTMLLVTFIWNQKKSLNLIPMSKDCPFTDGMYDVDAQRLIMMSASTKDGLHMVPSRDENGDFVKAKHPRKDINGEPNGKLIKERQIQLNLPQEYYVIEKEEIIDMIKRLAINADTFDYKAIVDPSPIITKETPKIEVVK